MARASRPLTRRLRTVDDVWSEGVLVAGGGRAILLQLADPAVAEGVARHSYFTEDPVRRLVGTLEYVYVVGFGTDEEANRVAREVGLAHRGVRGAGRVAYDARDPDLQLWVAATLYETTVAVIEQVYGRLDDDVADDLYRRDAVLGTALGMPATAWPADRDAFAEYWNERLAAVHVTPSARRVAGALMRPASGPYWMRAVMPVVRLVTAGLLPPAVRSGYGVVWEDRHQRRFDRVMTVAGGVYRALPRAVRQLPSRLLLRRFRRRIASPAGNAAHSGTGGGRPGRIGART
ncbi:oxygenase MpaB family protein [Naasia sp. SYSU D00948]|uniref:oxygenase MpaB family protein n=1 Tax=Naasia sp. SYSU D00948 TaxID=2817379 RepID=UPI001B3014D2|nr:oxygenase MpaB family protein [Naasia sp. SYSU D00948]